MHQTRTVATSSEALRRASDGVSMARRTLLARPILFTRELVRTLYLMPLDLYSLCPCGSGKKLKFCCKDVAPEIEKAQKLASSDQPRAALQHLQQLLIKHPQRASLLDLCAKLQIQVEEFAEAQQTVNALRAAAPSAPSGFAYAAVLAAVRNDVALAVDLLQDALERVDHYLPSSVLEAIGYMGHALLLEGDVIAARAHLTLFAAISPESDSRGLELLLRLNLEGNMPLMLRESLPFAAASPDAPWRQRHAAAIEMAANGLWRRARSELKSLLDADAPQGEVVYNLALMDGCLGRRQAFVSGMRRFSNLNVSLNEAVFAEAIAQLVDPERDDPSLATLRITFEVSDADELAIRFAADQHMELIDLKMPPSESSDAVRPRQTYLLLDRAPPKSGVDLACDDAPNVLAFLSLFGKQTDRDARLEATCDEDQNLDAVFSSLRSIGAETLGAESQREVAARKPISEHAVSWRWRLPDDTPREQRDRLLNERRRKAILEDWVQAPRAALDRLSPIEAAGQQKHRIPLLGSVLVLEQGATPNDEEVFQQLRDRLRLPIAQAIGVDQYEIDRLPLIYVRRYDLQALDDSQLARLLDRTIMAGDNLAALKVSEEVVARNTDRDAVETAFQQLIRNHPQYDLAQKWAEHAIDWALECHASAAPWVFLQLQLAIDTGHGEGIKAAIMRLKRDHFQEPHVAAATYRALYEAGLIQEPDPRIAIDQGVEGNPPHGPHDHKIWTPDDDRPKTTTAEKSALWTP